MGYASHNPSGPAVMLFMQGVGREGQAGDQMSGRVLLWPMFLFCFVFVFVFCFKSGLNAIFIFYFFLVLD